MNEIQRGPLQSYFFCEEVTLRTEIEEDCLRFVFWKVKVAINPFRATFFCEEGTLCTEIEEDCLRFVFPKVKAVINPFRATFFFF